MFLLQVSYASTSPALQNRELYPRFFRTISSDLAFNPARAALLTKYGWKRVATLHQNEPSGIFSQVCSKVLHITDVKLVDFFEILIRLHHLKKKAGPCISRIHLLFLLAN